MITLTRLGNGLLIAVNPDLIERGEHTPDTVITLIDGHKLVVQEPLEQVIALIRTWRASVAAEAITMARLAAGETKHTSQLIGAQSDHEAARNAMLADESAHGAVLGQVLHLPSREV